MKKLAVVVGLLLISSVADAKTAKLYQDNKSEYCDTLRLRILNTYDASLDKQYDRQFREMAIERATQYATLYNALCQD